MSEEIKNKEISKSTFQLGHIRSKLRDSERENATLRAEKDRWMMEALELAKDVERLRKENNELLQDGEEIVSELLEYVKSIAWLRAEKIEREEKLNKTREALQNFIVRMNINTSMKYGLSMSYQEFSNYRDAAEKALVENEE